MARYRYFVLLILLAAAPLAGGAPVAPPETGKLSWGLFEAVTSLIERSGPSGDPVPSLSALLILEGRNTEESVQALDLLGYTIDAAFGPFALVSAPGNVYIDQNRGIETVDFVSNAMIPPSLIANDFRTEGATTIGTDTAHELGFRGGETRIAIIDRGFLPDHPDWDDVDATYYLVTPRGLPTLGTYVAEGQVAHEDPHGAACAMIAADVAPDAELFLLSFPQNTSLIGWLQALNYAVTVLHADVVSTSMEFAQPTCHADGSGALNEAVTDILAGSNTTLIIAAGNWAQGTGSDRGFYAGTFTDLDNDFRHDFTVDATGVWDQNTLRFSGRKGDLVRITLEWDDWNRDLGTQDLDLVLSIDGYENQVAASCGEQYQTSAWPYEIIMVELPYDADYCVTVENRAAKWRNIDSGPLSFHINLMNLSHSFAFVEHTMSQTSVREIATNAAVIAVGAVPIDGAYPLAYSSRGPTSDGRPKPELYAPAGVSGAYYDVFNGTSASAPYVAGALAVLMSAFPDSTVEELLEILTNVEQGATDDVGNSVHVIDLVHVFQEASE